MVALNLISSHEMLHFKYDVFVPMDVFSWSQSFILARDKCFSFDSQ